jgi:hypothetical protein
MKSLQPRLPVVLLLAVALFLFSCHRGLTGSGNETDDDTGHPITDDDQSNADDDAAKPYNVIEHTDLGGAWDCQLSAACVDDYYSFLTFAAPWAEPISDGALIHQIGAIEDGLVQPFTDPLPAEELRTAIATALNISFLLDGINQRLLEVTVIGEWETDQYVEKHLLFTDPFVGTFEGIYLTPKGEGPFPAVIAIHGHRARASLYRDFWHGRDYPSHGLAILMLTMRVMAIDYNEHFVSRALLLNGFALMGLRVYEALLGFKYLNYRPEIAHDRIGLIGHSGGSSTSNLTVRLEPGFAAYVSDLQIDYSEWGNLWEPYHCETIPKVFPYHLLINDFTTSSVPVKTVPYNYTNGMKEIFDFFDLWLKP